MESQVIVWNLDARYRPELEVEIEVEHADDAIPGEHFAAHDAELEVEIWTPFEDDDWFVPADAFVGDHFV